MGNMSYCRFQNTISDLIDCQEHLFDRDDEMDDKEKAAKKQLIKVCKEIAADFEDDDIDYDDREED